MKTLYIECNMGVAGDMLMGALYELCDQKEKFLSDMNQAFAPYGVTLSVEPAVKCGISGTVCQLSGISPSVHQPQDCPRRTALSGK